MEIAKFEMDNDLLPIKDATARQAAADVLVVAERAEGKADNAQTVADRAEGKADNAQTVADRAEGKADNAQTVADRAEGKADDAQTVADRAEGKADDALEGILLKQNILNHPSYTGSIDTLVNNAEYNGYYFVDASQASGTQPMNSGFYMLLVFGGLQLAVNVKSATRYLQVRYYINNAWVEWRKVQLTT